MKAATLRSSESTGKNETLEQISHAFRLTREAGLVARGSVIIGLPYENRRTVEEFLQIR